MLSSSERNLFLGTSFKRKSSNRNRWDDFRLSFNGRKFETKTLNKSVSTIFDTKKNEIFQTKTFIESFSFRINYERWSKWEIYNSKLEKSEWTRLVENVSMDWFKYSNCFIKIWAKDQNYLEIKSNQSIKMKQVMIEWRRRRRRKGKKTNSIV